MPDLIWYRSLYWRIAIGFVALLAMLLVLQGSVFLWMTGRMTDLFPSRSPAQLAAAIAADVAAALSDQPTADLQQVVNSRYSSASRGFVVVMRDGRVIASQRVPPPPRLVGSARGRLFGDRFEGRGGGPFGGRGRAGGGGDAPSPGGDRGFRGFPDRGGDRGGTAAEFAPVMLDASLVGIVAVPREPPPISAAIRDLGPTLAAVAFVLLVVGTAVAALVIARPTHRRLRELQRATRAIGAGETGIRAPESGGDEVTALSRSFNEMAARLEQRTAALEAADRTRRQLLADVSHELMTPLAAILGYVETLQMADVPLDAATRGRYLRIINDEADRLQQIIGDLLDLARLEGGGGSLRVEAVSIDQLLERVRHRHAPAVAEKAIVLTTQQDDGIGALRGDQNRLEQALQNLVANAVRHTPKGGTVSVQVSGGPDRVTFRVDDTGPGVPPDQIGRVFDRFYKVDESRTGTAIPSGSGLGLSIVQAIVTRHGGTVSATNREDGGARFEIVLPLVPSAAS